MINSSQNTVINAAILYLAVEVSKRVYCVMS